MPNANPTVSEAPPRRRVPGWLTWVGPARALALLLVVVTTAVFWPAIRHPFMTIDDSEYVIDHPLVPLGFTWTGLAAAFTVKHSANWHPLATLSHMADCQLFGVHPAPHHLVSILLHAVNAALLLWVFHRMTGKLARSFFVAALFALHPLRVESVAWISERKDVLCAFFFLLTLWAYAGYVKSKVQSPKPGVTESRSPTEHPPRTTHHVSRVTSHASRYYALALVFFALALMSKPMAVTLPVVLLLLDYWPLRRIQPSTIDSPLSTPWWPLLREKIPFFLLSLLDSYITSQVQEQAMTGLAVLPVGTRLGNMFISYTRYLAQTFWPADLAIVYPYNLSPAMSAVAAAVGVVVLLSVLAWILRRRWPWFLVGWLWFLGMLVPVIGLVQVGEQGLADRYTYLPSIGILVLVVWMVAWLARVGAPASSRRSGVWARRGLGMLAVTSLAVLAILTRAQLGRWESSEKLMRHSLRVAGPSTLALCSLASELLKQGSLKEAASQYKAALSLDLNAGGFQPAILGLVAVYAAQGKTNEAEHLCRRTLAAQPTAAAHLTLADFLQEEGRLDEACIHYLQGLALAPYHAKVRNSLGNVYAKQSNWPAAREQYERALKLNPKLPGVRHNLGKVLAIQGHRAQAMEQFTQAIALDPSQPGPHNDLGYALALEGRLDEAVKHYRAALALKPDFAEAHFNLGEALARRGELQPAQAEFEAALQYQTNYARAHFALAGVFAAQKQESNVVRHLREAMRLAPDWVDPINNLAWLLATHPDPRLRDGPEAVRLAERALTVARTNDWERLDTLAAARAEAGQFTEAVAAAREALSLALEAGLTNQTPALSNRLDLYRKGLPYREPSPARSAVESAGSEPET